MSRYKVGDRVQLNAEYLKPHAGLVTKVQTFEDGSATEYWVRFVDGILGRFFASELTEKSNK